MIFRLTYLGFLGQCLSCFWLLLFRFFGSADTPCARARGRDGGGITDMSFSTLLSSLSISLWCSRIVISLDMTSIRNILISLCKISTSCFSMSSRSLIKFSYSLMTSSFLLSSFRKNSISFFCISSCLFRSLSALSNSLKELFSHSRFKAAARPVVLGLVQWKMKQNKQNIQNMKNGWNR